MMASHLSPTRRFRRGDPCPICGGFDEAPRGNRIRCHGFLSGDGRYAHCSREEHASKLPLEDGGTYAHRLDGPCRCGQNHGTRVTAGGPRPTVARHPGSSRPAPPGSNGQRVCHFDYTDADGRLLYQVVREEDTKTGKKTFRQRRPDPKRPGGWVYSLSDIDRVPYHLGELLKAERGEIVQIHEGEKQVDAVLEMGFIATTNSEGARKGSWHPELTPYFKDRHIVLMPDNDGDGRRHMHEVASALHGTAASIRWLELPNLPPKGDIMEWLAARGTAEELRQLVAEARVWQPSHVHSDEDEDEDDQVPSSAPWPQLNPAALIGLPGDIVRAIAPHTEADEAVLLINTVVCYGNAGGRTAHAIVGGRRHPPNQFAAVVGETATGAKGSSLGHIPGLFEMVDPDWAQERVMWGGLSSGEGLINAMRDSSERCDKEGEPLDPGVQDKRILVIEEEFVSVLKVMTREGNIVSGVIRQAWDSGNLRILTRSDPLRATGAHLSIIGHIMPADLRRHFRETDAGNGFANRFLWVSSRRSKELPEGGDIPNYGSIVRRLRAALDFARGQTKPICRDEEAKERWAAEYSTLTRHRPGLLGSILSRAAPHVLRLSLLYALMDQSATIGLKHLEAALALWKYCEASAQHIFGESLGDAVAETIMEALRQTGTRGLSRTEVSAALRHNQTKERITAALSMLLDAHLISQEKVPAAGNKPKTVYRICTRPHASS